MEVKVLELSCCTQIMLKGGHLIEILILRFVDLEVIRKHLLQTQHH
uniref:Uncharacterized protein n=1 Tax=Meloidogyne enterolobii TaxID=390850 RepID=A0A6V7UCW7_MELEN|nr:unnamed protein product [Meloidogyne enterolobii]